jgi:hypothetical protein
MTAGRECLKAIERLQRHTALPRLFKFFFAFFAANSLLCP